MKLSLKKDHWTGNQWPSVEIDPYKREDFMYVISHLCLEFNVPIPNVMDLLDGYAADLVVNNEQIMVHMDNWTFSIATERAELRDRIFDILQNLNV